MRMINVRNEEGAVVGRFDKKKAACAASSRTNAGFAWNELFKTAKGKFVMAGITCYEGSSDTYKYVSHEEALNFFTDYGNQADANLYFDLNKFEEEEW